MKTEALFDACCAVVDAIKTMAAAADGNQDRLSEAYIALMREGDAFGGDMPEWLEAEYLRTIDRAVIVSRRCEEIRKMAPALQQWAFESLESCHL
jgi:hypothetical protein